MTVATYSFEDRVATIAMDDGKANAISEEMLAAIHSGLDRAEADEAGALVICGRPGRFSGGFDLATLTEGGAAATRMVRGGFELAARVLAHPCPVVVGCTGHALAMGSFLVCAGDHRIGARGEFRIQANEVAIGLPVPRAAQAILRHRLTPSAFDRATVLAAAFTPEEAVLAGFLDELVHPDEVPSAAAVRAGQAADLDPAAHRGTKGQVRADTLAAIRSGIEADFG